MNAGLLCRPYQIVAGTEIPSDQATSAVAPTARSAPPAQSNAQTTRYAIGATSGSAYRTVMVS